MRNVWTIAKREFVRYFASPAAYVAIFLILIVVGLLFYLRLGFAVVQQIPMGAVDVLQPVAFMLMLITPAVTARTLAGEQSAGTIELLLTAPVRDWELVIGKWFGGFLFLSSILAITLFYPLLLNRFVEPGIDPGPVITGYLGLLLLSAALVAVGIFISSLFSSQVAAFLTTLLTLIFFWWMFSIIAQALGPFNQLTSILRYLDIQGHFMNSFNVGLLDMRDILYYLSLTALGLFLATMTVESRRWR